jgi:glycosyltransferase involved in cell wall biosynthesis
MADAPGRARTRVLMLVDSLYDGTGGAERFAVGLATALPPERYEVAVCATRTAEGSLPAALDAAGVRQFALGRRGRFDVLPFGRLARHLRRARIDVLHCHKFGSNVWGTLIGRAAGVPVVIAHEHTWSYEGRPLRRFLDGRVVGRLAHRFVAVSEADRRRMVEIEHVPEERTLTIPTGYVPRTEPAAGDLRAELGVDDGTPLVGTVAQLRPQKALEVLIEAVARLPEELGSARLVIAGEGPSRPELEQAAARLGVAERVHLLGTRTDVGAILDALDVAAMSSDFEGLPLFAFECMASGTPLVATNVGGLPEVIDDGETGLLVPARDPAALASALERLLRDPALRERLAAAARERVRDYELPAIAARFGRLYDELLAESGVSARGPAATSRG